MQSRYTVVSDLNSRLAPQDRVWHELMSAQTRSELFQTLANDGVSQIHIFTETNLFVARVEQATNTGLPDDQYRLTVLEWQRLIYNPAHRRWMVRDEEPRPASIVAKSA